MRLLKVLCMFFMFLLLFVPASYALTASIGNAKMILRPTVEPGKETIIEKSIKVNNVNDIPVDIDLEVHGDLVDIVELLDESFTLQPGETRNANFIIALEYGGRYEGKIGVKFTPVGGGQGVGLSSTIIILAEGPENPNPEIETVEVVEDTDTGDTGDNETGPGVTVGGGNQDKDDEQDTDEGEQDTTPTGAVTQSTTKRILPILVGFIIMMTIVAVGMAAYLLLTRGQN